MPASVAPNPANKSTPTQGKVWESKQADGLLKSQRSKSWGRKPLQQLFHCAILYLLSHSPHPTSSNRDSTALPEMERCYSCCLLYSNGNLPWHRPCCISDNLRHLLSSCWFSAGSREGQSCTKQRQRSLPVLSLEQYRCNYTHWLIDAGSVGKYCILRKCNLLTFELATEACQEKNWIKL